MVVEIFISIFFGLFCLVMAYLIINKRDKRLKKKLNETYDEKKDLSKQAEDERRRLLREGKRVDKGKPSIKEFVQSEGRGILQTTTTNRNRKDSPSSRGIFGKLRRRRRRS